MKSARLLLPEHRGPGGPQESPERAQLVLAPWQVARDDTTVGAHKIGTVEMRGRGDFHGELPSQTR